VASGPRLLAVVFCTNIQRPRKYLGRCRAQAAAAAFEVIAGAARARDLHSGASRTAKRAVGSETAKEKPEMAESTDPLLGQDLLAEMGFTDDEIARRKAWLEFAEEDVQRLRELNELAQGYADEVIEDLYRHFLSFEETRSFFKDPQVLEYVKGMQKAYFRALTQGTYDRDYIAGRLKIGAVHSRIGLELKWYMGAYNFYLRAVGIRLFKSLANEPEKAVACFHSLKKLVYFDMGLAIDALVFLRERTIRAQQEAIRELSTPVLQVREQLLILPIIGVIDSLRARQLTEGLLRSIRANRAKVVILDITGVPSVDSKVANHLVQTVEASRLMGAAVIVTGLSAEVAQALVTIGVDLSRLQTVGDLQGGIEAAERLLGYQVVRDERPTRAQ
jgi:rsbT co-antagonist protein RsbR